MWRRAKRFALLAALLGVGGSTLNDLVGPVVERRIDIRAIALRSPELTSSKRLRFVEGWQLKGRDQDFGGLSGLLVVGDELLTISDKGALVTLSFVDGKPATAHIHPLPKGCERGPFKRQRDSEALAQDERGNIWIAFEWRNAICRADPDLDRAPALAVPVQMESWPQSGGPEAMTRLRDGRMVVIAERSFIGRKETPLLIFPGDPTDAKSRAEVLSYRPPSGYRPTDVAELPDGSLLLVHRRFRPPFSFSTILSVLPAGALMPGQSLRARALALMKAPGLAENFEGVAVERRGERTFIWLLSDDNFAPTQKTYLLKFELTGT